MTTDGSNPSIVRLCALVQGGVILAMIPLSAISDLSILWSSGLPSFVAIGMLYSVALYLTSQRDPIGGMVLAIAMVASMGLILSPAQYFAVRLNQPLIDPWLARADALLGIHVPDLARWTAQHPALSIVLNLAYWSLVPQCVIVPIILQFHHRRDRLWEFVFHFHFCAVITVTALALVPAACAFQYYGFTSTLPQQRFIEHFNGLRDGTFRQINFQAMEGLISMPSFHAALGLMATWVMRGSRPFAWFLGLNAVMVAATVLSGAHYAIDVVFTFALFAVSVLAYRLHQRRIAAPAVRLSPLPSSPAPE